MKKINLILIFIVSISSLYSNDTLGFDTNISGSEYNKIKNDILYVIKNDSLKRNFIPKKNKKIISENIQFKDIYESQFIYELKTVKFSNIFDNEKLTPFYTNISINGNIEKLFINKLKNIELVIKVETVSEVEIYNYYGPPNTKEVRSKSRSSSYKINFNIENIQNIEKESNLYFVGITRRFSEDELKGLTLDELGYLRNEFYARKGFIFKTSKMKSYFYEKSWFKPITRDVKLTETELENVYLIRGMEQEINFGSNRAEVDELNRLYEVAQLRELTINDIGSISTHKLPYLRNTFFAKKGYIFSVLRYNDYFEAQNWYVGSKSFSDNELSELDKKNINFIKSNETKR